MSKYINPRVATMREAIGKIVGLLTERKIEVTQRGHKAFVTYSERTGQPKRVNIPYMPDDSSNELLDAVQGFIDHEIGHIFFTDYKVLIKARSLGLANLHNVIEDTYVERKMKAKFTGAAHNIGVTMTFFFKNYTDKELKKDPSKAVALLMVPAIRAWAGQREAIEYMTPDKWAVIKEVQDKLGDLVKKLPDIKDSQAALDLALEFRNAMRPPEPAKKEEEKPEGKATGGKGDTPEEHGEGPSDRETDEIGDFSDTPGDRDIDDEHSDPSDFEESGTGGEDEADKGSGAEDPDVGDGSLDLKAAGAGEEEKGEEDGEGFDEKFEEGGSGGTLPGGGGDDDGDDMGGDDHHFESEDDDAFEEEREEDRYTESHKDPFKDMEDYDDGLSEAISEASRKVSKDTDYLIWTKDFDKVGKFVPRTTGVRAEPLIKRMGDRVDHMVGTMQKDLERAIAARSRSVWRSGLRRGRINASALARLSVGDDRVFRKREVSTSKDVAVCLLVDCSGSMRGTRIETAGYASYALSATLDRMSISHEVIGFTTEGDLPREMRKDEGELGVKYSRTENIWMPVFKEYSERMTPEVKRRLATFPVDLRLSENVDGECVEIAAQRLLRREESRKVMIVLSDGAPACPGDRAAQSNHLKKVVLQVMRAGIDVVGVGIQTTSVQNYYPKSVVLNDVADLSGQVIKQLRALLLAD